MNRIPNYRVWHKIEKRFLDLRSIDFEFEKISYDAYREAHYYDVAKFDEIFFQQCTGIKDSERIDIYEGDIIEFERNDKKCIANIFYHDAFVVTGNSEEGTFVYAYLHDLVNYIYKMKIKVIGNIFEHPELLKNE